MLVLALQKELEIIGEAAGKVSPATRECAPLLPWEDIIGMRHRLIHAYFDVNLEVVWNTVCSDLAGLISELESLLDERK